MRIVRITALAFATLVVFSSCDLLMSLLDLGDGGVTVTERINLFEEDLNKEDRSQLVATHFHPEDLDSFDQMLAEITVSTSPFRYSNAPFVIGEPSSIDTVGDAEVATCDFSNGFAVAGTVVFTLKLDGADYKIRRIVLTIEGASEEYVIERYGTRPDTGIPAS